jgi:hypothetical protein
MVMGASVRVLRWRRRGYVLYTRRRRVLRWLRFPSLIGLPGGRLLERHVYLYWRIRLPLWLVLPAAGWLALGWTGLVPGMAAAAGIVPGAAAAIAAEMVLSYRLFSYRRPGPSHAVPPSATGPGGPGDFAGVREPRRPGPAGGSGAAELRVDPAPPGLQ